jgi:hypothetical protein
MKSIACLLKSLAFFAVITMFSPAMADEPSRIEGRSCTVADRGAATWFGFFKGKRDVFAPLKGGNRNKVLSKWRCFETEDQCNSWQYWMQADFPDDGNEAFCRQGG